MKTHPHISAALATLRTGGSFTLQLEEKLWQVEPIATVAEPISPREGEAFVLSNRLAKRIDQEDAEQNTATAIELGSINLPPDVLSSLLFLAKAAHILPCLRIAQTDRIQGPQLDQNDLVAFQESKDRLIFQRTVRLPTCECPDARAFLFTDAFDSKREHVALLMGEPKDQSHLPLVRVHSKCLTGDVLGSLRCDCGEQLTIAKRQIAASGFGALIYLDQEGRGIGLRNKMTAYELQDQGMDTFQANHQLGYEDDERTYDIAAAMLQHLKMHQIRLLTNNPDKISQLSPSIQVIERIALIAEFAEERHAYLDAKKASGHLL